MGDCDEIGHRQLPTQQESLPMPVSKQRIFSLDLVKQGDYLIEDQVILNEHHCLVESVSADFTECTVIESWWKKIVRRKINIPKHIRLYKLEYHPGAYSRDVELVVDKARELVDQRLFDRKFARKRFIHYLKTEREDEKVNFTDIRDKCLLSSAVEQPVGTPLSVIPVSNSQTSSFQLLKEGDHIIYTSSSPDHAPVYRSALTVDLNIPQEEVRLMTLKGSLDPQVAQVGVVEESVSFHEFRNLHKVTYSFSLSSMEAIQRAKTRFTQQEQRKETFNSWNNNSHLFVTWCKTGKEDTLTDILTALRDQERENPSYPVLFKTPVKTCDDIAEGDHIMCKSNHFLVHHVLVNHDKFDAYTVQSGKCTLRTGIRLKKGTYKIEYGEFPSQNSKEESLQLARNSVSKNTWNCSCKFVTEMKCGTALYVDDRCLIDSDVAIVSCTKVTKHNIMHVSVEVGDHVVIKAEGSEFHSALVSSCIDEYKFRILPPLPQSELDEIDILSDYEVYRLNYKQSLPSDEVLKRARCKFGISKQHQCSRSEYVTWAKVGKTIQTPDVSCLNKEQAFIALCSNIHRYYEIILSPSDIKVGDHIFINRGPEDIVLYRKHMLVTELKENTVFKVAFCLRTSVQETEVDLGNFEVYRIKYIEELPSEKAVERARSMVGKHKLKPLARLWFVTWAKTGFDSVEVSLLQYRSKPTSKSKISCFTQLNPGDYLVRQRKWCHCSHYLVLSVESPTQCTACESRCRKIRKVNLTWTDESNSYYRINYEANVCYERERSIQHAKSLLGDRDLSIMPYLSRQRFVHYMKTGERMIVNIDELSDDHFMSLKLEQVISTSDLKRGDHVYRAVGKKLLRVLDATHHMLIDGSCSADEQTVKVLHYQVSRVRFQKGAIANEHVNLFEQGELFRIPYPDRFDPKEAIETLKGYIARDERIPYNLLTSNCEHLITGVITGVAFSSQVEHAVCKLLKFSRSSVKNNLSKYASHGSRDVAIHSAVHHSAAAKVRVAQRILLIKSALATGGIALALNLFIEIPLLVRKIYKLLRRRKFHDISDVELKRHVIQEICESVGVVLGSVVGAVIGQILIPIPMLGSIAGGVLGVILGQFFGLLFGWLISKIVRRRRPVSLPTIYCKEPLPVD